MATVLERSIDLSGQVEDLREDSEVSKDAKLLSLTIESVLLRIEDRLITIEENLR